MRARHQAGWSRRRFLDGLAAAGASALVGLPGTSAAAEPPPETTRIRIPWLASTCRAPEWMAAELLRAEGFTDVQYVKTPAVSGLYTTVISGEADLSIGYIAPFAMHVDDGKPVVMLAGIHAGCFELFAANGIRSVRELKGRAVSIPEKGSAHQVYLSMVVSSIGLNAQKDIQWVVQPPAESVGQLAEGKIDAIMAFAPLPQELRARKIGNVIMRSVSDKPWSQYFCCVVGGNREFVRKHPVATKRAVRAFLKAAGLCATQPEATARALVDRGFTKDYQYALEVLKELPYSSWRDFSAEDSVRFFALRLQENGLIKSSPKKILAQGTDWRFLNELKQEVKG